MALQDISRRAGPYSWASNRTYTFGFKVFSTSQVAVTVLRDSTETVLNSSLYTVTLNANQDNSPGGTVVLASGVATADKVSITSDVPYTQEMVLTNQGGFYPDTLNTNNDRIVAQIQQLKEGLNRAIKVDVTSTMSAEEYKTEIEDTVTSAQEAAEAAQTAAEAAQDAAEDAAGDASDAKTAAQDALSDVTTAIAGIPTAVSTAVTNEDIPGQVSTAVTNADIPGLVEDEVDEQLGNTAVRVTPQTFTEAQKQQARMNLDVAPDLTAVRFEEQSLTTAQKAQARTNIGAQATLTFDNTPTESSTNPVTSDGIKTAVDAKVSISGGNASATVATATGSTTARTLADWMATLTAEDKDLQNQLIPGAEFLAVNPSDCGGDLPSISGQPTGAWGRATQGIFVDPYDNVMYVTTNNASGQTCMYALRWSEDPTERVQLANSGWKYDFLGHQGNSLYRPSEEAEPLLVCKGNPVTDANTTDNSRTFTARVIKWDYSNPSTFSVQRTFTLFDSTNYDNTQDMQLCVSYDQKKLIAMAIQTGSTQRVFRVWDLATIMAGSASDISSSYEKQFNSTWGNYGGQGIASDGQNIYLLSGTTVTYIGSMSVDGLSGSGLTMDYASFGYDSDAPFLDTSTYSSINVETEGLFFAPYNGRVKMFLHLSVQGFYVNDPSDYARFDRFLGYIGLDGSFYGGKQTGQFVLSGDYAQGTRRDVDNSYQTICGGSSSSNGAYLRLDGKSSNSGRAQLVANDGTNNATLEVKSTGVSTIKYNATDIAHRNVDNSYVRMNGGNSTNTGGQLYLWGGTHSSSANGFQLNCASVATARLKGLPDGSLSWSGTSIYPYNTNTCNLGDASHLWKEIFAETGTINTSDERLKDNIRPVNDLILDAWGDVNIRVFQFRDAIEKKGDSARHHVGVIAQQIKSVFESYGLDPFQFGLLCYDEWEAAEAVYDEVEVIDQEEVCDDEGNILKEKVSHIEHVEVFPARPAGNLYSIRYEEALVLEAAYQRRRASRLEAELESMDDRLATLERKVELIAGE